MNVVVAGDFYPDGDAKLLIERREYKAVLDDIAPIIKQVDYAIVNYESPVTLGKYEPIAKCGPNLSSTEQGVEAIKWTGFDMATLANNHTYDFGTKGLMDTIKTCNKYGIDTVGVGRNLIEAAKVFYKEINGSTLAIINCCEHEFSIARDNKPGAFPLNPILQYYQIKEARKKADYVLMIVHGGHEHFQSPSPRMVETYRFFVDIGVDAVVNHHQHCHSGYEVYKGKPIFYGLGNFCFEKKNFINANWNYGFLVQLSFNKDGVSFALHPYSQCNGDHKVQPLANREAFDEQIKTLNSIINNTEKLDKAVDSYYASCDKGMSLGFQPYNTRLTKGLYMRGLLPSLIKGKLCVMRNMIDCESHRDKVLHFLTIKDYGTTFKDFLG